MANSKKAKPSKNGANGRGADGKFTKGNPGGPGNPFAKQVADTRAALYAAVTEEDIKAVVAKMVRQARAGDAAARKEMFDRLWGKAAQPVNLGDAEGGKLDITVNVTPPNNK